MVEVYGNIWDYLGRAIIALTTNGSLARDGRAVVGRGVTRQACSYFPDLPQRLGLFLSRGGNHVHLLGGGLVSFPVEETAWSRPDITLIARSAGELRELADRERWEAVVVPRPGCGGGGLEWKDVIPLLQPHFDGRFLVISPPQ